MRFSFLPDAGTDGGEKCILGANWDAYCMDARTEGGDNCVLGTNWDAYCMDAGTEGGDNCVLGNNRDAYCMDTRTEGGDNWAETGSCDSDSTDGQGTIDDLVFRAGLSAPRSPSRSLIEFCERDIAKHSKAEENIAKNNI